MPEAIWKLRSTLFRESRCVPHEIPGMICAFPGYGDQHLSTFGAFQQIGDLGSNQVFHRLAVDGKDGIFLDGCQLYKQGTRRTELQQLILPSRAIISIPTPSYRPCFSSLKEE